MADLAVPAQDPFAVPIDRLPATESLLTIVGGRVIHAAAEFQALVA